MSAFESSQEMSTSRTGLELRVDSYQFFNIVHLIRAVTDSIMRSKLYFYDLVQGIVMENFLVHHVPNSFGFKGVKQNATHLNLFLVYVILVSLRESV